MGIIRSTSVHPSAHWVYERLRTSISGLSLATVYRNINLFRGEGLIKSVCVVDGEERFDGRIEPHLHFICTCCGGVFDLPYPDPLFKSFIDIEKMKGFTVDYRKTVFYGLCVHCTEK